MGLRALGILLLLAPAAAAGQLSPPPPPPAVVAGLTPPPPPPTPRPAIPPVAAPGAGGASRGSGGGDPDGLPMLGLQLDGGFPDGLGASILFRPVWFARLHGGATYNFLGPGLRAGATLLPLPWAITPTASVEYGHAFDADAAALVARFGSLSPTERELLRKVGYDYLSAQLGIETGSPRSFTWFLRAGVSWVWTRAQDFQQALQADPAFSGFQATDPRIRVVTPSLNTGVALFF